MDFNCNMCLFSTNVFSTFQKHFVRRHKNDPNFYIACCVGSCCYTTKKWGAYRVHVHRKHPNYQHDNVTSDADNDEDEDTTVDFAARNESCQDPCYYNALYALALEAKHNVSHTGIDGIASSTSALVEQHINNFKKQMKTKLEERKYLFGCC